MEAETKESFKEHTASDGQAYAEEVEPDMDYFISFLWEVMLVESYWLAVSMEWISTIALVVSKQPSRSSKVYDGILEWKDGKKRTMTVLHFQQNSRSNNPP